MQSFLTATRANESKVDFFRVQRLYLFERGRVAQGDIDVQNDFIAAMVGCQRR
jgi:hypothetical protein